MFLTLEFCFISKAKKNEKHMRHLTPKDKHSLRQKPLAQCLSLVNICLGLLVKMFLAQTASKVEAHLSLYRSPGYVCKFEVKQNRSL